MSFRPPIRLKAEVRYPCLLGLAMGLLVCGSAPGVSQVPPSASPAVLDRAEAVVNNHVILASDLDREMQLSALEPIRGVRGVVTRQRALQLLISRTLIQQQIRREEARAAQPSPAEVQARIAEIRKQLPDCARRDCASDSGWQAFLASRDLRPRDVETYLRSRLEILHFIELRFREGVQISRQEIDAYYRNTLLPQYPPGEKAPPLETVSSRIQEILLQQRVNTLFSNWLQNLRQQGDIEVLDPSLETPAADGSSQNASPQRQGKGGA
ncbi:MAG: peptidylprolyl isomerase [Acidobacteriota bacterium]